MNTDEQRARELLADAYDGDSFWRSRADKLRNKPNELCKQDALIVHAITRALEHGAEIVGHKTFNDGHGSLRHEPLTRAEADALIAHCKSEDERRKALMPDERSAIRMMMDAHTRLTDMGWKDAVYCPKDGTVFEVIEPGSIGIFKCQYEGEWPKGTWWILGDGDMFPARPVLFRPIVAATSGEGEG